MKTEIDQGFDVLVVATNHASQERAVKQQLEALRGTCIHKDAMIIFVSEDWPRGAGTALGPILAYTKAYQIAKNERSIDLLDKLISGASMAIYYLAGENKKLAPLTLAESNNRSDIKLPGFINSQEQSPQLTLLQALVKQTSLYAKNLKGRMNVFSGDQIFLPFGSQNFKPKHNVEFFGVCIPFPSEDEWKQQNLENRAIIVKNSAGKSIALEKINYPMLQELIKARKVDPAMGLAISFDAVSLSGDFFGSLITEFNYELQHKEGKLNAFEHLWMPLTLDQEDYIALMQKNGCIPPVAKGHYMRRQSFINSYGPSQKISHLIGIIDLGPENAVYDIGTLKSYFETHLQLTSDSDEGKLLRQFYSISDSSHSNPDLNSDKESILVNCKIKSGNIKNSVLFNVEADHLEISNSLIINSNLKQLKADHCVIYNTYSTEDLILQPNTVRADFDLLGEKQYLPLYTQLDRNGEADWNQSIAPNHASYAEIAQSLEKLEELNRAPIGNVPNLSKLMTRAGARKITVLNRPKK